MCNSSRKDLKKKSFNNKARNKKVIEEFFFKKRSKYKTNYNSYDFYNYSFTKFPAAPFL